jgi:hypothetical protein
VGQSQKTKLSQRRFGIRHGRQPFGVWLYLAIQREISIELAAERRGITSTVPQNPWRGRAVPAWRRTTLEQDRVFACSGAIFPADARAWAVTRSNPSSRDRRKRKLCNSSPDTSARSIYQAGGGIFLRAALPPSGSSLLWP